MPLPTLLLLISKLDVSKTSSFPFIMDYFGGMPQSYTMNYEALFNDLISFDDQDPQAHRAKHTTTVVSRIIALSAISS